VNNFLRTFPHTLFLSLQAPAAIRVDGLDWDLNKPLSIRGVKVEGNDTPWCALADLLMDRSERTFVGVTFSVDSFDAERVQRIAGRLDHRVVYYETISMPSFRERYRDWGDTQRFEIRWGLGQDLVCEGAQLVCGQWFWWYASVDGKIQWERPIAFSISDMHNILRQHNMTFPDTSHLPRLTVEYNTPDRRQV
jgi:hypothetical protein